MTEKNKNQDNGTSSVRPKRCSPENIRGFLEGYKYALNTLRDELNNAESLADARRGLDTMEETLNIMRQLTEHGLRREQEAK
jgi:hypothetical protein